ncbi:hemagglutinin repeat-containing protein, partial [Salmonella enterica subsp. enterica]
DGVKDTSHDNSYSNDSKFFGISKDESRKQLKDSTVVASNLRSDSNLKLQSAKDIQVSGSQVSAAGKLQADAKGDIKIASADNTTHDTT